MDKWEYKMEFESEGKFIEVEDLNSWGAQGWELVTVTPDAEEAWMGFYFKRLTKPEEG